MSKFILLIGTLAMLCTACVVMENAYSTIPPGVWRGTLALIPQKIVSGEDDEPVKGLVDDKFEEVSEGELPFNFEVIYDNDTDFHIVIFNGEEKIQLNDITVTHDRATNNG